VKVTGRAWWCASAVMDSAAGGEGFERFEMEERERREEKMRKGRFRLGVLTLFRGLQEKTTAHGLPHVHNARGTASFTFIHAGYFALRCVAASCGTITQHNAPCLV